MSNENYKEVYVIKPSKDQILSAFNALPQRIMALFRMEKTFKIIKSEHIPKHCIPKQHSF